MNFNKLRNLLKCPLVLSLRSNTAANVCSVTFPMRAIHTTKPACDLMEFFDSKKNWGETHIRVGRSWKLDELRLKSNVDLHKLWYILLKERNMLYTMEHECKAKMRLFPNPERIDKVQESMDNIETVVRERNVAYYQLETGETGEQPVEDVVNLFGLPENYKKSEYFVPKFMNSKWVRPYLKHGLINSLAVKKFYRLYQEKLHNVDRKARNRDFNHVQHLLKRFPDMDMNALKAQYPDVDLEKAKRTKKARGHFQPKY